MSKESQRGDKRCMFATVLDFVADSTGIIGVHLMERENPCAFCYYFFFWKKMYLHCFLFSTVVLGLDISIILLPPIYSSFRILLQIQYTILKNLWGTAVFVFLTSLQVSQNHPT